jgi:hypothetical protein
LVAIDAVQVRFFEDASGVAQIFNLLYRRPSACRARVIKCAGDSKLIPGQPPADYKSATQHIENLRYLLRQGRKLRRM